MTNNIKEIFEQNNTLKNIILKDRPNGNFDIFNSDNITKEQAILIAKTAMVAQNVLGRNDITGLNIVANMLALMVVNFNSDIEALLTAPREMIIIDLAEITKAFDFDEMEFIRDPSPLLSSTFKGMF